MNCKYCHKPAGLFSNKHEDCEAKHTVAVEKIREFFKNCTNDDTVTYDGMKKTLASEIAKGYVSDDDFAAIIKDDLSPLLVNGQIENGYFVFQFWDSLPEDLRKDIKSYCKYQIWKKKWKKFFTKEGKSGSDSNINCLTGSGFIISDNILATNYHVIEGADLIEVALKDRDIQDPFSAKVIATGKTNDLALLMIDDPDFKPLKPAPYRITPEVEETGTPVFTMGYPQIGFMGREIKVTDGIISAKTGFQGDKRTYQISAPIQGGNSGGTLFDKTGKLIGITCSGIDMVEIENVAYAIKSACLLNLIKSAPIEIALPEGEKMEGKELNEMVKAYTPYVAQITIYQGV